MDKKIEDFRIADLPFGRYADKSYDFADAPHNIQIKASGWIVDLRYLHHICDICDSAVVWNGADTTMIKNSAKNSFSFKNHIFFLAQILITS